MIDKILDGDDRARELNKPDFSALLKEPPAGLGWKAWNGQMADVVAVRAYINGGRWLAACPDCGSVFYVTPRLPVHFCPSCGNAEAGGGAAPVLFPEDREYIEKILMRRPVYEHEQRSATQRAAASVPLAGDLRRDWEPGVSVETLLFDNAKAGL